MQTENFMLLPTNLEVDNMICLAIFCARKSGSDLVETENDMTKDEICQIPKMLRTSICKTNKKQDYLFPPSVCNLICKFDKTTKKIKQTKLHDEVLKLGCRAKISVEFLRVECWTLRLDV